MNKVNRGKQVGLSRYGKILESLNQQIVISLKNIVIKYGEKRGEVLFLYNPQTKLQVLVLFKSRDEVGDRVCESIFPLKSEAQVSCFLISSMERF